MAIDFTDETAVPAKERENEFREVVKYLSQNLGAVKSYVVSEENKEASEAKVAYDKRKMAEAANELSTPVTIRTPRVELLDDGKSFKVYITAVKKIKRTPKPAAPAAEVKQTATKSAK
jgi:hypothetical protein